MEKTPGPRTNGSSKSEPKTDCSDALVLEASDDMVFVDNLQAFTWNPNPGYYRSSEPDKQYACLLDHIFRYSEIFGTFVFTPELTKEGNVHIHGMYTVRDRIKYHKKFLPYCKKYGFIKIKPVDEMEGWVDYLTKDLDVLINVMPDVLPVPLTHCNVGTYKRYFKALTKVSQCRMTMGKTPQAFMRITIKDAFKKVKKKPSVTAIEDEWKPDTVYSKDKVILNFD